MRKDKWELLAALAALAVVAGAGTFALRHPVSPPRPSVSPRRPPDRINPAVYSRIHAGMTEAEVSAVVGYPPGDLYARGASPGKKAVSRLKGWGVRPNDPPRVNDPDLDVDDGLLVYVRAWDGRRHILEVVFDSDGKVVGCVLRKYFNDRVTFEPD